MSESRAALSQQLPEFVDLDFARRLEMAETISLDCVDELRRRNPSWPIAAEVIAGGVAFSGGLNYPANQIVGMGLYGEVTANDVDQLEHFFRSRGMPSTVVISPLADPTLLEALSPRGYRIREFNSVLILRINPDALASPPPGVTIERVTPETTGLWASVLSYGFSPETPVSEHVFDGFAVVPGALAFLARIEGAVAGGCVGRIIAEARIAALSGAATLPLFRRRGVQSALIARRLQEAADAGCDYAVVSTMPDSGSQRNMERRGFRVAYTKVVMVREWPEITPAPGE